MVQLDKVAACYICRLLQSLCVLELLTIGILRQAGAHIVSIAWVLCFVRLFHVSYGHGSCADRVLLAEQIDAAILTVIVKVYPITACGIRKAQLSCQVLHKLVMHLRRIKVARQQHPSLYLLLIPQQIGSRVQLDLIGFLICIGKGRIAPRLNLLKFTGVNRTTIRADHAHRSGCNILFVSIYPIASLSRVTTGQIHGRNGRRLHHTEGHCLARANRSGDFPISSCIHICNSGKIYGATPINSSLVAGK